MEIFIFCNKKELKKENPPQILGEVNESSTQKQTQRKNLTDLKLMNEWQCSVIEKKKTKNFDNL
jgi:signal recognition particle receptor subunit beta